MAVQDVKTVGMLGVSRGALDVHKSVVRGVIEFYCGCGNKIILTVRKPLDDGPYEWIVTHGTRERTFSSKDPNALEVFDRMWSVTSKNYVKCKWPKKKVLM